MDLQRYVESILAGRYGAAETAPPTLELAEIDSLARRALYYAQRPDFADPRHIAVALGLRLLPRAPRGLCGEGTALGIIAYRWDADPSVRGLRVAHGVAHAVLAEERGEHGDADAWLLTAAIVVPPWATEIVLLRPEIATAHAPRWLIDAALGVGKDCAATG